MSSFLDDIESSAASSSQVRFLPSGELVTVAELWARSGAAMGWMARTLGTATPVALIMESSPASLAVFLAGFRSGRRVVSLPPPPRAALATTGYTDLVRRVLAMSGAATVVCDPSVVAAVQAGGVDVHPFDACAGGAPVPDRPDDGELVQFTSGSTSEPRGVRLPVGHVSANIDAILARLEARPGDRACSWLPLSHDMGLIGMTLGTLAAGARRWANGSDLTLIRPESFVRRPELWLRTCADVGATVTASPDFGLNQAVRRAASGIGDHDLSRMRVCIVGGEPVRPSSLQAFSEAFGPRGFSELALCPAYGLAEAALAVTMVSPGEPWRAEAEVVSCGTPLDGYEVAVGGSVDDADEDGSAAGTLVVSGPSVSPGYLADGDRRPDGPARLVTSDQGYLGGGELFVLGRVDDVVGVAGRNIHLADVEHGVVANSSLRRDRVCAVKHGPGYAVLVEGTSVDERDRVARRVNQAATGVSGVAPVAVCFVTKGSLLRTTSGKPRRTANAGLLGAGSGAVEQTWTRAPSSSPPPEHA